MKIAVDKTNYKYISKDNNEYVYVFDNEKLSSLLKTKLHCINYQHINNVDVNTTDYEIRCKKKAKITDNFDDLFKKRDYKFGIIVPNYNYEHTIEKCLNSIFSQTYTNYEIIFVDDCSTDNSIDVAQATYLKYASKEMHKSNLDIEWQELPKNFKLVRLKQKRYNGGARNEAYLHLSDDVDYVYYVDSDDWLYDKDALKNINDALIGEPDVLFVGLAKCKHDIILKDNIPNYKDRYEAMQGWSGSCGKVIKKELATSQKCLYNEGTLKEDKNQHCRICIYMNDFKCLDKLIYVWNQDNYKSITTIRENIIWGTSTIRHYADTLQLALSVEGQDEKIDEILQNRIKKCKDELKNGGDKQY